MIKDSCQVKSEYFSFDTTNLSLDPLSKKICSSDIYAHLILDELFKSSEEYNIIGLDELFNEFHFIINFH